MGTLYVDERGEQRAFRVSKGKIAVGSGEEAKLRLASEDVADVHAELEIADGDLWVVPRPGVVPPRVQGVDVKERVRLGTGQELRIGGARLVWKKEDDAPPPPPRPVAPARAAASTPRAASPSGRRAGGRTAQRRGGRAPVRRGSSSGGGMPPALKVGIAVVVLGGAAAFVLRGFERGLEESEAVNSRLHFERAQTFLDERNYDLLEERLDRIVLDELEPAERRRVGEMRAAVAAAREARAQALENAKGDDWFEFKLSDYEKRYLDGDPGLPVVRVFLERCAEFRERWPNHPELDWVERQERRFAGYPGLDRPEDLADVAWKVDVLTNARPRDYRAAFALLEAYRAEADGDEREDLDRLVSDLEQERSEYHQDQLRFAQAEYEVGNKGRAFEWMVQSILGLGDEGMADEAAEILIDFPNAEPLLRGYRAERPDDYARLVENDVVGDFARARGIE